MLQGALKRRSQHTVGMLGTEQEQHAEVVRPTAQHPEGMKTNSENEL